LLRAAAIAAAIHFSAGSAAQAENCVGAWSDPQPYSVKVEGVELEIWTCHVFVPLQMLV
jgi:hypothetical protein